MKTLSLPLIAVFLLFCSCNKETQSAETFADQSGTISITLSSASTKTVMDGKNVVWCANDAISVFDGSGNHKFTTNESGLSATFIGTAASVNTYSVLYPYDYAASLEGGIIDTFLPTDQVATVSGFAPSANLSAARLVTDNGNLYGTLRNVGCYLKIPVTSSESGIKWIKAEAIGGESLSGSIVVSFDGTGVPIATENGGMSYARLVCQDGVLAPGYYYLVMLPGTLSKGLRVTVANNKGVSRSHEFKTLSKLNRNVVYNYNASADGLIGSLTIEDLGEEHDVYESTPTVISQWNNWSNSSEVKELFLEAQAEGKTYCSMFKFYNYEKSGNIANSFSTTYGKPYVYGLDLYMGLGTYFPEEYRREIKSNLESIIHSAWRSHRAIPSLSWHLESPYADYSTFYEIYGQKMGCRYVYGNSYCDFPRAYRYQVRDIVNNKKVNYAGIEYLGDWFDDRVREVADFINGLVEDGTHIPIILRLWHELESSWAWWQVNNYKYTNCSRDEYIALFRLTVDKLRTYCPEANILFAYCPNRYFESESVYLTCYPGDDYVDFVGYDDYQIGNTSSFSGDKTETLNALLNRSRIVSKVAGDKGKIAAIFETNNQYEGDEAKNFYNDYVQEILTDSYTHLGLFQLWSESFNTVTKKNALIEFINQDNVIFGIYEE